MSSAGKSGASGANETERLNDLNGSSPEMNDMPASDESLNQIPLGTTDAGDEEVIEVITYETTDATDLADLAASEPDVVEIFEYNGGQTTGFRWWYIPAVALPLAAATGGAIWYTQRRQNHGMSGATSVIASQGRDLVKQARRQIAITAAKNTAQRNVKNVSDTLKNLPDQASSLRDKSVETLSGLNASDKARQASAALRDAIDTLASIWERQGRPTVTQSAKNAADTTSDLRDRVLDWLEDVGAWETLATARDKVTSGVNSATGVAQQTATKQQLKTKTNETAKNVREQVKNAAQSEAAQKAREQAKKLANKTPSASTSVKTTAATAAAKSAAVTAKAKHTTNKAQRAINTRWRQMRAFTFAMIVSAIISYLRSYAQRRMQVKNNLELRETAGGRMVRDA